MIKLPSKKVLSIFIISVSIVATAIILSDKKEISLLSSNILTKGESVEIPQNSNWQSELDLATQNALPPQEIPLEDSGSVTDEVSKSIFSNYLVLKQNEAYDPNASAQIVNQALGYIDQNLGSAVASNDIKLNIIPDNGKLTIYDYGEKLGLIMKNSKPEKVENEMEIFNAIISTEDANKVIVLDPIISTYKKVLSGMEGVPVPKTFVLAHTDMVRSIKNIVNSLENMKLVFNDPIKSLEAIKVYGSSANTFQKAFKATASFIISNNIEYKQGSGGYYLLYGI